MTSEKILNELPKMLRGYADMLDENILLTERKEILEEALEYANPYYTVEEFNKKYRLGWDKNKVEKNKKYMDAYCRANYIIVRQCQNKHSKFETRYPFSALETLL